VVRDEADRLLSRRACGYAAAGWTTVQNAQRVASTGIVLRHSGHVLVGVSVS
jgi:hypothetical protein